MPRELAASRRPRATMRPSAPTPATVAAVRSLARLNAKAWGVAVGLLAGLGLLAATWILVILDGPVVGPHLSLLGVFLPGYSVTWLGGLVGFVYAFVGGYAMGRLIGYLYNLQVSAAR
jgi:hypothetical protein